MQAAARKCPRLVWTLALGLGVPPVAMRSPPASAASTIDVRAQTPDDDTHARLEAIYSAANEALQAGNYAAAAERYAEVLRVLGESRETHESRALALLDSVAARRQAQAQGLPQQLCRARDLTRDYLAAATTAHGAAARDFDGVRQAQQLQRELADEISRLSDRTCPGDQVKKPPPDPEPPLRLAPAPEPGPDRRVIAGGVLLGVGGLGLVLMATGLGLGARASSQLQEARRADPGRDIDGWLMDGRVARAPAANNLAIAGSVLAGVALVAGVTLLVIGKTAGKTGGAARGRRDRALHVDVSRGGLALRF